MGLGDRLEQNRIEYEKQQIKEQLRKYKRNEEMLKKDQDRRKKKRSDPLDENKLIPLKKEDPGFEKFVRWYSYPHYRGAFKWQLESHDKLWPSKFSMELVHRKAGKSVKYAAEYQHALQYLNYDVLLLGWTARRKEVAAFVYKFFRQYDLIEVSGHPSPYHFKIKNGGKFDCYLITGKETLGMHSVGKQERFMDLSFAEREELRDLLSEFAQTGILSDKELDDFLKGREGSERKLWISIDDPIDIVFMKERWREKELELRFDSTLYSIDPDKWSFTGTHKFQGDIFDYWRNKFKEELVTFISGPIKKDGSLLCPELFTHPSVPTYKADLLDYKVDENVLPILDDEGNRIPKVPKRCLAKIQKHIGPYAWQSEWLQKPHPVTGEVWDHIEEELMLKSPIGLKHDLLIFAIDRATTEKETSSYTGCVLEMREIGTGNRVIFEDWTGIISFDLLLIDINDYVIQFRKGYEHVEIVIIVEQQGGGSDFVTMARNLRAFTRPDPKTGKLVHILNQIADICVIIEIHNTGNKINRIREWMNPGLLNGKVRILKSLRGCEVWNQIIDFPNSPYLDAIDGLANVEHILLERYPATEAGSQLDDINKVYEDYAKGVYDEEPEREAFYEDLVCMGTGSKLPQHRRKSVF